MKGMWVGYAVGCTMGLTLGHAAWQIDRQSNGSMWNFYSFQTCWLVNRLFVHWSRGWGVLPFSERFFYVFWNIFSTTRANMFEEHHAATSRHIHDDVIKWKHFRVTGHLCWEFPAQRPVTRSFHVFFDLRLDKPLSKQSWGWWFETPSSSLWRHCNAARISDYIRYKLNDIVTIHCQTSKFKFSGNG